MKKFSAFKIVQFALLALMSVTGIYLLLRSEVKQFVFASTPATILFFVVWGILVASFIFILIDFNLISSIKLTYHNLYNVVYSDQLSGLPNRFSCDTMIEKYCDSKLPQDIGCIMIELVNLPEVNSRHGHIVGNKMLKDFSSILSTISLSLCFVGRNGGNKFLAIFEECDEEKLEIFCARLAERVDHNNRIPDRISIEYKTGAAFNTKENLQQITDLIALANQRIHQNPGQEEPSNYG